MRLSFYLVFALMLSVLAGCTPGEQDALDVSNVKNKTAYQLDSKLLDKMAKLNMPRNSPIMMRILKEEGVLEIWKAKADNRFELIKDYKICAWSGALGPKKKEGDRQAPEGFYEIEPWQMNPNSNYYLAFNIGYPNQYDRVWGHSGSNLMVHGACSSSGCYSMTDAQVLEIFAFARDAFKGGQKAFQVQALPFRMTAENMVKHRLSPNIDFWNMLKVGYDHFEITKRPPEVAICDKKYAFNQVKADGTLVDDAPKCPAMTTAPVLAPALEVYNKKYEADFASAMSKYEGYVWKEPTEAERKAVVAQKRIGKDIAYAPTGNGLEAGKLVPVEEAIASQTKPVAPTAKPGTAPLLPAGTNSAASAAVAQATAAPTATPVTINGSPVPIPQPNPLAIAQVEPAKKKPFWQIWGD